MAVYVICHGGWGGGWQFKEVAALLRAKGHEVFTPTLTGLGERTHLASPDIDLNTHIQDILMVLRYEDLHDVILVGQSYAGMVITGVAEKAPERLGHLVYLDAVVPEDGQSMADIVGPDRTAALQQRAEASGDGWRVPLDHPDARISPLPIKTGLTPVRVRSPEAAALPRTFIYCTEGKGPDHYHARTAEMARADRKWRYRELNTRHESFKTAPRELVDLLLEIA
jgi:pimeloyl-ACP methyl ester carboxylesterase